VAEHIGTERSRVRDKTGNDRDHLKRALDKSSDPGVKSRRVAAPPTRVPVEVRRPQHELALRWMWLRQEPREKT